MKKKLFIWVIIICLFILVINIALYNYIYGNYYLIDFAEWYSFWNHNHLIDSINQVFSLYSEKNFGNYVSYPTIGVYYLWYFIFYKLFGFYIAQKFIVLFLFLSLLLGFIFFGFFITKGKHKNIIVILSLIFMLNPYIINHIIMGHIHLFFNMVGLIWSGIIFLYFLDNKKIINLLFLFIVFLLIPLHPLYIPLFFLFYVNLEFWYLKRISILNTLIFIFILIISQLYYILPLILSNYFSSTLNYVQGGSNDILLSTIFHQSKDIINSFTNSIYFSNTLFLNGNLFLQQKYDFFKILLFLILIFLLIKTNFYKKKINLFIIAFILITLLLLTGIKYTKVFFNLGIFNLYKEIYHFTFILVLLEFFLFSVLINYLHSKTKIINGILIFILLGISFIYHLGISETFHKYIGGISRINTKIYNNSYDIICKYGSKKNYTMILPFYHVIKTKLATNFVTNQGGGDSLLSSSCIKTFGNDVTLNIPFRKAIKLFNDKDKITKLGDLGIDTIINVKFLKSGNEIQYNKNKILSHLNNLNSKIIYNDKYLTIYKLIKYKNIFNSRYKKSKPFEFFINISRLYNDKEIIFLENFYPQWKLYLKNQQGLFTPPLFDNTHKKIYDYANSWTISKQEIIDYVNKNYGEELKKEGYPKKLENLQLDYKYYKLNPDGSIDTELTLYFKPQLYFYIGLIISATTFLLLILWLIVDSVKERRKRKEEKAK